MAVASTTEQQCLGQSLLFKEICEVAKTEQYFPLLKFVLSTLAGAGVLLYGKHSICVW